MHRLNHLQELRIYISSFITFKMSNNFFYSILTCPHVDGLVLILYCHFCKLLIFQKIKYNNNAATLRKKHASVFFFCNSLSYSIAYTVELLQYYVLLHPKWSSQSPYTSLTLLLENMIFLFFLPCK